MFYAGIDMDQHGDLVKYTLINGHVAPEHREKVDKVRFVVSCSFYLLEKRLGKSQSGEERHAVFCLSILSPFFYGT